MLYAGGETEIGLSVGASVITTSEGGSVGTCGAGVGGTVSAVSGILLLSITGGELSSSSSSSSPAVGAQVGQGAVGE